ncbi:MAG: histidine kinase [Lewinellaceae bacterium]|nr:histidine kinase [Lewinellaceae bacterium]
MQRSAHQLLGFNDTWFRLLGIPIVALIIPPIFFNRPPLSPNYLLHSVIFTTVVWEGNRQLFILASRRYPALEDWRKRLKWVLLTTITFTGFSCTLIGGMIALLLPLSWQVHDQEEIWVSYGASYLMLVAIGAIYESVRFFSLWQQTYTEKKELEKAHLASQLEGLRNQVNPHFLFNSLNTLSYLISEDPDKATRFLQKLSKVYRYVLESRDNQIVSLEEEQTFLDSYLFLLKERFGENFQVNLTPFVDSSQLGIVPLSLQILVENVIKHNIISAESPLVLEIYQQGNHLVVRNNLQRKFQVQDSTGVGLENIRQRFRILTQLEVQVIVSQTHFTVLVPLISLHQPQSQYERVNH